MNYRKGDIFKTELMQLGVILVHGCNSRGKMGSGFAKSFAKKYPDAFKKYVEDLESKEIGLGGISWAAGPDGVYLASGITQLYYGRDVSHRYVSYDAIDKVMDVVFLAASKIDFPLRRL